MLFNLFLLSVWSKELCYAIYARSIDHIRSMFMSHQHALHCGPNARPTLCLSPEYKSMPAHRPVPYDSPRCKTCSWTRPIPSRQRYVSPAQSHWHATGMSAGYTTVRNTSYSPSRCGISAGTRLSQGSIPGSLTTHAQQPLAARRCVPLATCHGRRHVSRVPVHVARERQIQTTSLGTRYCQRFCVRMASAPAARCCFDVIG